MALATFTSRVTIYYDNNNSEKYFCYQTVNVCVMIGMLLNGRRGEEGVKERSILGLKARGVKSSSISNSGSYLLVAFTGGDGRPELRPAYWYLAFFSEGFRI